MKESDRVCVSLSSMGVCFCLFMCLSVPVSACRSAPTQKDRAFQLSPNKTEAYKAFSWKSGDFFKFELVFPMRKAPSTLQGAIPLVIYPALIVVYLIRTYRHRLHPLRDEGIFPGVESPHSRRSFGCAKKFRGRPKVNPACFERTEFENGCRVRSKWGGLLDAKSTVLVSPTRRIPRLSSQALGACWLGCL